MLSSIDQWYIYDLLLNLLHTKNDLSLLRILLELFKGYDYSFILGFLSY